MQEKSNEIILKSNKKMFKNIDFTVEDLYRLEGIVAENRDKLGGETVGTFASLGLTTAMSSMGPIAESHASAAGIFTVGIGAKLFLDSMKFKIASDLYDELKPQFDAINKAAAKREDIVMRQQNIQSRQEFKKHASELIIESKDEVIKEERRELSLLVDDKSEVKKETKKPQSYLIEKKSRELNLEQARLKKLQREKNEQIENLERMRKQELEYHNYLNAEEVQYNEMDKGRVI